MATGAAGIVISIVVLVIFAVGMNSVTEAIDKASGEIEEKQNKVHAVTYKVTSEKPVTIEYGDSKERKEEKKVVGSWEKR